MPCQGTSQTGKPCKRHAVPGSNYCYLHQFSSIVISERCHATGRNGQQCKHRTIKGVYCHQHHAKLEHVRIAKSTIPGAHLGLMTTALIKKGENIVPYTGDIIVSHDADFGDDYTLQVKKNPPTFISARKSNTGAGRYANARIASRGQGQNNAQLIYNTRERKAYVRATKDIPAKAEITVPYGAEYWRAVKKRNDELAAKRARRA